MKILLTGFEPFDNSPINPSEQVVQALAAETISGVQLAAAILPVDLQRGPQALIQAITDAQPQAVICLGQASRRSVITLERVAVNLLDFRIPDNAGNQVSDQSIVPDGPAAYFTTLPVRAMLERLKADGIPAALSLSAGTYLCNQIFYVLRHHLETWEMNIPAGFIHLPDLPEQAARKEASIPSMSLTTMILGVRAVLELIAGS